MNLNLKNCAAITAALLLSTQTALAGEVKTSGTACWTGSVDMLATSKKDAGWTWQLTGTYVDDNGPAESNYYRCIGRGGFVGGKLRQTTWWCLAHYEDGSTALTEGKSNPDRSATSIYISGTGRHEGVTGEIVGPAYTRIGKPPQGQFAACRTLEGTKVLKEPT